MNYTGNYSLKKPEDSDVYDVQDFNDNADAIDAALTSLKEADDKAAGMKEITLAAEDWSTSAPYTQKVSVTGITASDLPILVLDVSGASDYNEEKTLRKQFGWLSYYDTAAGSITVTAMHKKPTVDLVVGLKGVV